MKPYIRTLNDDTLYNAVHTLEEAKEDLLDILDLCTRAEEIITNIEFSGEPWESVIEYKSIFYNKADYFISKGIPPELVQYFIDVYKSHIPYVDKLIKYAEDCNDTAE